MFSASSYHSQKPPGTHKIYHCFDGMLGWRAQKTSAIKPHTKFDKWCHIHAQHLPSSCRHIHTTDTGFKPLSITKGSKACLLAGRSWSKFPRALSSKMLLEITPLLIRNSSWEEKDWSRQPTHRPTDQRSLCQYTCCRYCPPLLGYFQPCGSAGAW